MPDWIEFLASKTVVEAYMNFKVHQKEVQNDQKRRNMKSKAEEKAAVA